VKAGTVSLTTTSTTSSVEGSVAAPAPTQAGIPTTCNAYSVAKAGDGCELFASRNGITVTQLCEYNTGFDLTGNKTYRLAPKQILGIPL
jgi:hypothetical protein